MRRSDIPATRHLQRIVVTAATLVSSITALETSLAHAEIVQFRMTGTISVNDDYHFLPPEIHSGAPFVAYVAWDTSVSDGDPDPHSGYYSHPATNSAAPYGIGMTIGPYTFESDLSEGYIIMTALPDGVSNSSDAIESSSVPFIKSFGYHPYMASRSITKRFIFYFKILRAQL